jgi:hypothetical protein
VPTPTQLAAAHRVAASLTDQADVIRARVRQLVAAGDGMRWQSRGHQAFRTHLDTAVEALERCAREFDSVAESVLMMAAAA